MIDLATLEADIERNCTAGVEAEIQRQLLTLGHGHRLDQIAKLRRLGRLILTLDPEGDLSIKQTQTTHRSAT